MMKGWRYFTNIFGDQSMQNSGSGFEPISCDDQPGEDVSLLKNSVIPVDQRNTKRRFSKLNEMIDNDDMAVAQESSLKHSNKSLVETSSYFQSLPSALEDNLIPDLSLQCPNKICPDTTTTCTCSKNKYITTNPQHMISLNNQKSSVFKNFNLNGNDIDCCKDYGIAYDDIEDKMVDCDDDEFQEVRRPLCPSANNHINTKISSISWPKCSLSIRPPLISKTSSLAEKNLIEFD